MRSYVVVMMCFFDGYFWAIRTLIRFSSSILIIHCIMVIENTGVFRVSFINHRFSIMVVLISVIFRGGSFVNINKFGARFFRDIVFFLYLMFKFWQRFLDSFFFDFLSLRSPPGRGRPSRPPFEVV